MGRQKALHLLGAALPLDAATALELGLVDKVCDDETDVQLAAWEFLAPFLRHTTGNLIQPCVCLPAVPPSFLSFLPSSNLF